MTSRQPIFRRMPYSRWWPIAAGALAGVILRLVYSGSPGEPYAAMAFGFIVLAPLFVGGITVYMAEARQRRSWGYYVGASALANTLFVAGTMAILLEGLICAVVILPLFLILGVAGGLAMGVVCRMTRWPKQTMCCLSLLPIVLGGVDTGIPLPQSVSTVERSITIDAGPDTVWERLLHARQIQADEIDPAWLYRIGVPLPQQGEIRSLDNDVVRRVEMGKGIYFDEVIQERTEHEYVRWTYRFYEDSFPPNALDEHVVIGGHYFDVLDTAYSLVARGQRTELEVVIRYRVSTRFNWYAKPVARFLMGNLAESNLELYRRRSEATLPGR